MMNLGTNAWHAMKDQNGRLAVSLERVVVDAAFVATQPRLHPGLYARLSISDNGTGMNLVTLSRIFDPFFTTKRAGEGTGLGLSVVNGIMESHDGAITVESELGVGTVFRVYFPAYLGEVPTIAADMAIIPRGRGERVLVVDDEEVLALMMRQTLSTLGYKADFATDPAVALALVCADVQRFDLVLTDLTMPGMTGLLLAAQLRQVRADLPIILLTGYSATLTAAYVKTQGLQDLLQKPISIQSLGFAVHAALSIPSSPSSLPAFSKSMTNASSIPCCS
jgi:CheY-like chemotaxis protein